MPLHPEVRKGHVEVKTGDLLVLPHPAAHSGEVAVFIADCLTDPVDIFGIRGDLFVKIPIQTRFGSGPVQILQISKDIVRPEIMQHEYTLWTSLGDAIKDLIKFRI